MSSDVGSASAVGLAEQLDSVAQSLMDVDLPLISDEDLLTLQRSIESARRRLDAVEFRVINRAVEVNLAFAHGCKDVAALLRSLFTITPARARAGCATPPRSVRAAACKENR